MGDFNSELDWSPESWFANRVKTEDGSKSWTDKDARILASHVPEYLLIEKESKANGTWLKLPDGSTYLGDPRDWVMMQSKAYKKNYSSLPWYSGQSFYKNTALKKRFGDDTMWFSNSIPYAKSFAYVYSSDGIKKRKYSKDPNERVGGHVFVAGVPKNTGVFLKLPTYKTWSRWDELPFRFTRNTIEYFPYTTKKVSGKTVQGKTVNTMVKGEDPLKTDDVVDYSKDSGYDGTLLYNIMDGPPAITPYTTKLGSTNYLDYDLLRSREHYLINEFISNPGFTKKLKFINGNNGNFDVNNPDKYAYNPFNSLSDDLVSYAKKGIKLIPRKYAIK